MKTFDYDSGLLDYQRVSQGMTLLGLARRAKVGHATAWAVLRGHSVRPDTLRKVCEALGVDVRTVVKPGKPIIRTYKKSKKRPTNGRKKLASK